VPVRPCSPCGGNLSWSARSATLRGYVRLRVHSDTMSDLGRRRYLGGWGELGARIGGCGEAEPVGELRSDERQRAGCGSGAGHARPAPLRPPRRVGGEWG